MTTYKALFYVCSDPPHYSNLHYVFLCVSIVIKLFKAGLAAQSEVSVNWCPALGKLFNPLRHKHINVWILVTSAYCEL